MPDTSNTTGGSGADGTRDELLRLVQVLVVEGQKIVTAFAVGHGLHPTDVEALTRVLVAEQRGAPVTAGALAADLGLTTGSVTALIGRLEQTGHLTRNRDQSDGRRVLLRYSERGGQLAEDFFAPVHQASHAVMDGFSDQDLSTVRRFLAATTAAMAAHRASLGTAVDPAD